MNEQQPLTCFPVGKTALISKICTHGQDSHKLMIFGLIVGATVKVLQLRPVMVLQINYTEFALDRAIAGQVWAVAVK